MSTQNEPTSAPSVESSIPSAESGSGAVSKGRGESRRDWLGSIGGLLIFVAGISLLTLVFKLAFEMFQTPPRLALKIESGKPFDISGVGDALFGVIIKIALLFVMSIVGSVICNRGIHLYASIIRKPKKSS